MTQIINDKLKKICENCREKCDKPCAWISLGNEYCDDIMEAQQELERLNNIIDELEKYLKNRIDELQEQEKIYQLNNGVPIYELFTFLGTIIRLKELKGSDEE